MNGNRRRSTSAQIQSAFAASIAAKRDFLRRERAALIGVIERIAAAFARGNKLLFFGNGGSAADAQHLAAEFVNRYRRERPPLPAIALTTDSSALTSIANDYRYDDVFAKQLIALARPGDIAIAISTSGNARNVVAAARTCRRLQVEVIALTGGSGGKLAELADLVLSVRSSNDTARIQETHILIGHVICEQVDEILYGERGPA
ncbi:MAG TPA: D-sedoheptulose 7-phosphate isomerase [Terriglobales bacterium]|nr:D-sedoheptulose 7-phosphate isomerase [Terriglobales bacterium]